MDRIPTDPIEADVRGRSRRPRPSPAVRPAARNRRLSRRVRRTRAAAVAGVALAVAGSAWLIRDDAAPPRPQEVPGSQAWASAHYGNPDSPGFRTRHIAAIDFLGRAIFVHEKAARHFLRLERLFEARAPEYAAAVAAGELDDWGYANRPVRGERSGKSNHAFGLAIDVNALTNVLGTTGDVPDEVVRQWEIEGGEWGGDWSRPDPMHFETHLTPAEIASRYRRDGTPRPWYLAELVGG